MKKTPALTTLTLTLLTPLMIGSSAFAKDHHWNKENNPANLDSTHTYSYNIDDLPLQGEMENKQRGWSDSYWPKVNGWIADRWQVPNDHYKEDSSPTSLDQIRSMSQHDIDLLSPAEKFDLARGRFDFPIASYMRDKLKNKEYDWRGVCNGWTHASLNIDEPHPFIYTNKRYHIQIPFGSGDIKGLLAYYYGILDKTPSQVVGLSCRSVNRFLFDATGACDDINAAAFHIVMANELGIKHQGFAADKDPGIQVWNQPFVKFESVIDESKTKVFDFSKDAAEGTRKEITVTSTLTYANELYDTTDPKLENSQHVAPTYQAIIGTSIQEAAYRKITYTYTLELDKNNDIIGGAWIGDDHPDMIWRVAFHKPGMAEDHDHNPDDWSLLNELVQESTTGSKAK